MQLAIRIVFSALLLHLTMGEAHGEIMNTSWYQSGHTTASGMRFNPNNPYIAAHKTLKFGTHLLLKNPANGRTLCVKIQDRGPFIKGRQLDITRAGAERLNFGQKGVVELAVVRSGC
jgi:rare lipoprotein A